MDYIVAEFFRVQSKLRHKTVLKSQSFYFKCPLLYGKRPFDRAAVVLFFKGR